MKSWESLKMILEEYISENYVSAEPESTETQVGSETGVKSSDYSKRDAKNLEDLINEVGETFHDMLFRKIMESDMTDADVYKRANLDRKLFSKIRNNPAYHPRKGTVLALAVALKLNLDETIDFLSKAEYALSPSNKGDLIIKYFIEREVHDIFVINYALCEFDQPLLGA